MAMHKIPQDVEADDKFLGPLSFKQFIFFGLAGISGYLTGLLLMKNLWFLSPIFGLPTIVFGFLAFPWSKEQPTELWLAARIRFLLKPRKRVWDQTGMKDLVTITVPKKVVHAFTDGLTQKEVRNRMNALATMVDSRGWAVKNYAQGAVEPSDRLVDGNITDQSRVAIKEVAEDVMDEDSGVLAQQFESKIQQSEAKHKEETRELIARAREQDTSESSVQKTSIKKQPANEGRKKDEKSEDFWFMHQQQTPTDPNLTTFQASPVVHPGDDAQSRSEVSAKTPIEKPLDEAALLEKVHEKQRRDALQTSHIKHYDPFHKKPEPPAHKPAENKPQAAMTTEKNPDILKYAYNNDLNVETIQRQGHKDDDGEVVISLH